MSKELEELFEKKIRSSATAYKWNPMRSERKCSFGRKLADIDLPELFLCANALLLLMNNIFSGLVAYPAVI
jgi:adenylosuccinate lyase